MRQFGACLESRAAEGEGSLICGSKERTTQGCGCSRLWLVDLEV